MIKDTYRIYYRPRYLSLASRPSLDRLDSYAFCSYDLHGRSYSYFS